MPIPADFVDECLYTPEAWFIHDVLSIQEDAVQAVIDTTRLGLLVDAQRPWPGHPRHLPGAVVIQATGTLGAIHAVYAMDMRPSQGWVGFGTHIRQARFGRMGTIGPPVQAELRVTKKRQFRGTWFFDYTFRFEQGGDLCYASEQTAAWVRSPSDAPR